MKTLVISLFLSTALFAVDAPTPVDCEMDPGSAICKRMAAVKNSFGYTCTGAVCYSLWRTQIQEMKAFAWEVNEYLPYSFQASQEMGKLAWNVADVICRSKQTGEVNWMTALFKAKVAARDASVNIQKRAGLTSIRSCKLTLN